MFWWCRRTAPVRDEFIAASLKQDWNDVFGAAMVPSAMKRLPFLWRCDPFAYISFFTFLSRKSSSFSPSQSNSGWTGSSGPTAPKRRSET